MPDPIDFVLIPGAWMGAWAWDDMAGELRSRGHRPHSLTLSGLDADDDVSIVGLETHVTDVATFIETRDLRDIVLVGHSYSGLVAGLVADRMAERVAHVVYVAAFLPREGKSMLDAFPPEQREDERRQIEEQGGRWPPPDAEGLACEEDLSESQRAWLSERFVGHPGRAVADPVGALKRPLEKQRATYVVCTLEQGEQPEAVADLRGAPTWTIRRIVAGHFPMLSFPGKLAALLASVDTASARGG